MKEILLTGIGSVSPYGTLAGAIAPRPIAPRAITAWPASDESRAYLVEPFRPTEIVPGLKTRRLDRLSVWSLVAASLAVKDAGLDINDPARVAVVSGTGLGCLELSEAFFRSANEHGWEQTDPILFPETLSNAPAGHIARHFGVRGPNLTVSSKGGSGECALLQAVSLLRNEQADAALVLAGDTLTQGSYEWYEAAGWLARGFVPSEGVTALVLQQGTAAKPHATVHYGEPEAAASLPSDPVAAGMPDSGGLLRLAIALGGAPRGGSFKTDGLRFEVWR